MLFLVLDFHMCLFFSSACCQQCQDHWFDSRGRHELDNILLYAMSLWMKSKCIMYNPEFLSWKYDFKCTFQGWKSRNERQHKHLFEWHPLQFQFLSREAQRQHKLKTVSDDRP